MSDCIRPIMLGTPTQQVTALPQIDPQIAAACKERDPNFGKGGRGYDAVGRLLTSQALAPPESGCRWFW
jgi:hypothetical protein